VTAASKPPRARLRDVWESTLAIVCVLILFAAVAGCVRLVWP
jgi:hypothetical protein